MENSKSGMRFYSLRKKYNDSLLKAISKVFKGSGWKKYSCTVFRERDGYFFVATISGYFDDEITRVEFAIKPMVIDSVLWEILDMVDANKQPLSYRAWGSVRCFELVVDELSIIDNSQDAELAVSQAFDWINARFELYSQKFIGSEFSVAVRADKDQIEHGSYSLTLIVSLILEGKYDEALELSKICQERDAASGVNLVLNNESVFKKIENWIECHTKPAV